MILNKNIAILTMILVLASAQSSAFPNDNSHNPPEPPSFSAMDSNGDGVLDQDELKGPMRNDFNQIDADHNKEVTELELNTFMKNHQPPMPPEH
ncbi:hypothetical protein CSW98_04330 [Vibrio sp. HA2012]|nr:hypothetical protein CSW98_04330 [Vibrio sp. HA2012]